jgi:hypothetical protein
MKRFIVIALFLFPVVLHAQSVDKWRAGSAKELSGNIYTLSCFISGPDDEWTYDEKLEMLKLLNAGQAWIKKEALKYSISLEFNESGTYGLNKDIKLQYIERGSASGKESVDWVANVFHTIGYNRILDFDSWIRKNTNANNYHVIMFVKGAGISYALPYSNAMDKEKYYIEAAVVYEKYINNVGGSSSLFAHEILHLYGAWDLYKTFAQSEINEQRAKKLFPNSVMLRISYNIDELEVDSLTAWLIGWNMYPQEWYETFRTLH